MTKNNIISALTAMAAAVIMAACSTDEEPQNYLPTLVANNADGETRFSANLSGTMTTRDGATTPTDVYFLLSESQSLADADEYTAKADASVKGLYRYTIEGLTPGTTYYYTICARSGGGVAKGDVVTFSTLSSSAPTLTETLATSVNENGALLMGSVTDNGGKEITQWGFAYKVYENGTSDPTIYDKVITLSAPDNSTSPSESSPLSMESQVSGLQAQTRYVARAFARNSTNVGYGAVVTFTTEELKIPQLTCTMGDVTAFAATPTATISTNGGYAVTRYGFCWSTESQVPTTDHLTMDVGTDDAKSFSKMVDDLTPQTTYYMRAYAINEKGTGYSNAMTFTTEARQTVTLATPTTSEVGDTLATVSSSMTVPSGTTVTEKGICYSLYSSRPTTDGSKMVDSSTGNNISAKLTGLKEGGVYYLTAYAVTRDGTFYSDVATVALNRTYTPSITMKGVSNIGETEATVTADVTSDGGRSITERGICWSSTSSTPTLENGSTAKAETASTGSFAMKLSNLTKGQKYYVRAYAKNVNGTTYTLAEEFTTSIIKEPELTNLQAVSTHDDHVTLQAVITSNGGAEVTEKGFLYSTKIASPTIGAEDVVKVVSTDNGNTFKANITGLSYNTLYYMTAYATNEKGTAYTTPDIFYTSSTTIPSVQTTLTQDSVNIQSTTAVVNGQVTSDGGDGSEALEITEVGFCYSSSTSEPTLEECDGQAKATLNTTDNSFSTTLTGLRPYTYYYVRSYAKNKNGIGYSWYRSFRTQQTTPGSGDNSTPGTN
jgi:hypothetical protein